MSICAKENFNRGGTSRRWKTYGNMLNDTIRKVVIHDYQTAPPKLLAGTASSGKKDFWGEGVGMIYIPNTLLSGVWQGACKKN